MSTAGYEAKEEIVEAKTTPFIEAKSLIMRRIRAHRRIRYDKQALFLNNDGQDEYELLYFTSASERDVVRNFFLRKSAEWRDENSLH